MPNQRLHALIAELIPLFSRDLDRLKAEVNAFESSEDLWVKRDGITNSAGNLTLHLCGNLRHFIGHVIGGSDYVRNRDLEFSATGLSKDTLINEIEQTQQEVVASLEKLDVAVLNQPYPIEVFGRPMNHGFFLIHLSGHLNYHLGQINYFRRLN